MAILRLFDVSQYIYIGNVRHQFMAHGVERVAGNVVPREIPVGGLTYLIDEIEKYKSPNCDLVFCIDKPPKIKRALHEKAFPGMGGYKGNRVKADYDITIQKQMAEEILRQMGYVVIAVEDFEADDVIASIVKYYESSYDKIYIHSKDSDLYYLISDTVECIWPGKGYKCVNRHNFKTTVNSKYDIEYNMITLQKMLAGEPGDNVPSVPRETMQRVYDHIPPNWYSKMGDNELLRLIIEEYTDRDPQAIAVMELIMPLIADYRDVELYEEMVDEELLTYYKEEFGMVRGFKGADYSRNVVGNATIEKYIDMYSRR